VLFGIILPYGPIRSVLFANGPSDIQWSFSGEIPGVLIFLPLPPNPETGSKIGDFIHDPPPSGVSRNQFQSYINGRLDD
jgi:hypothetical protein